MAFEPALKFSRNRSESGRSRFSDKSTSSSPMPLFPRMANLMLKESSTLLITSGSNSIRSYSCSNFSEIYLYLINILGLFWRKICGFWFTSGVYGVHELRWVSCVHWRLYDKARSVWRALGFLAGICCLRFLIFCLVAEKNEGKTRILTASFSFLLPFFFKSILDCF